jgi:hypothetical protein
MPCSLLKVKRRFGEIYRLHVLKWRRLSFTETSFDFQWTTRRYIQKIVVFINTVVRTLNPIYNRRILCFSNSVSYQSNLTSTYTCNFSAIREKAFREEKSQWLLHYVAEYKVEEINYGEICMSFLFRIKTQNKFHCWHEALHHKIRFIRKKFKNRRNDFVHNFTPTTNTGYAFVFFFIWFVRLLALRQLLSYCASLG